MIRYFVEKSDEDRRYLLNNLLIEKEDYLIKRQGIYHIIYLTFKDKKHETELINRGITNIKKLVIVFKGKEVFINDVS